MSKVKYYYDSETLSYKEVKRSKKTTFKYFLLFVLSSGLFALLFVIIGGLYFQSPKEKSLERELTNLLFQYEILSKKIDNAYQVLENVEQRDNNLYRHYFETNPIPVEQRRAGFGGINRYKKFEGYDNSGNYNGDFYPKEYLITFNKSYKLSMFSIGTNLKYFYSKLYDKSNSGMIVDIGADFSPLPTKDLRLALVFSNIGFLLGENQMIIPSNFKFGTSFKPEYMPLRFSLTYNKNILN